MSAVEPVPFARPRLLEGWYTTGQTRVLGEHAVAHGPLPLGTVPRLIDMVSAAGLRGRGGAWFPTARKLASVASNGRGAGGAHVIVNGVESEPAASKDKLLLRATPHLVLDGAELAALAVGAKAVTVCVHRGTGLAEHVARALSERAVAQWGGATLGLAIDVAEPPRWYVSSESTALANFVGGGPGKPRDVSAYREGVAGRPTLVSNAETFAHLALIARHGPAWFRGQGTPEAPGTGLFSVSGSVHKPGVYELPLGVSTHDVFAMAGGVLAPPQAVLVGGYGGSWVSPSAMSLPLTPEGLRPIGASPGAGILIGLHPGACGLAETARVAAWLAANNARQCGPCFNGLPAIADDLARLIWRQDRLALDRLRFRLRVVDGRGACAHPDGVVRLVTTALEVFASDIARHLSGTGCPGMRTAPVLPLPQPIDPSEGWR